MKFLESRDDVHDEETKRLYNFLIYEEEVSLDYIYENEKLLENKDSKYYNEIVKALENRKLSKIYQENLREMLLKDEAIGDENIAKLVSLLRQEILRKYKKDHNINAYLRKEAQISEYYSSLIELLNEERLSNVSSLDDSRSKKTL